MTLHDPSLRIPPLLNFDDPDSAVYGFHLQYREGGRDAESMHLLNLNPQDYSLDEPLATAVTVMQNGGKVVESRGGVLKNFRISGTTGHLPPVRANTGRTTRVLEDGIGLRALALPDVRDNLAATSGFAEFYSLRLLFRQFMFLRRRGKPSTMFWLDFKGDEFWIIEPQGFRMRRSLRHRFTYEYDITFQGLEPSESVPFYGSEASHWDRRGLNYQTSMRGNAGWASADAIQNLAMDQPSRRALYRLSTMRQSALKFINQFTSGSVRLYLQKCLGYVGELQTFFADLAYVRRAVLSVPLSYYRMILSSLIGLSDAVHDNTTGAINRDLNEWWLEARFLTEGLAAYTQRTWGDHMGSAMVIEDDKFTDQRARFGSASTLLTEVDTSTGSLEVDPFIGASGLQLIGDVERMASTTTLRPEMIISGETIFDLSLRLLGNAQRFVELVVLNRLSPPYIVGNIADKPSQTLAWGEYIMVPAGTDQEALTFATPVDAAVPSFRGTVSAAGTASQLIDADIPDPPGQWRVGQWEGFTVTITSGLGAGQVRVVTANDGTILTVSRAWDVNPGPGDEYSLAYTQFTRRRTITAEARAYGRDILAVFQPTATGQVANGEVDVMLGPTGDFVTVEGEENFEQALLLFLGCEAGTNLVHPTYGLPDMMGRPASMESAALYTFYARQGLYADPRVREIKNPRFVVDADKLSFQAQVQPIKTMQSRLFRVAL